ncbi:hypothetical protein H9Q09_00780 [Aurantimonas sp. DM33-3]|uniref:hypothetical protein n=1 Tax=Aurantimonas sp. DM33-3 TaxID=2766955 RepID=UPI001652049E|nr:hypothetical protein [Aurantimonas sp. DM33-3]MBC6714718.1 hypothetical protein [Aurantimonas sp. DM33-3]
MTHEFVVPPRFMTDEQLRAHFGLTERALRRFRATKDFPKRDVLAGKTDSKAVDRYFDRSSGLEPNARGGRPAVVEKDRF